MRNICFENVELLAYKKHQSEIPTSRVQGEMGERHLLIPKSIDLLHQTVHLFLLKW